MESSSGIYELLLLPRAQADVENILRFISERSPQGAIAWRERWDEALDQLRSTPLAFELAPESASYETEVRQLLFKTRRGRIYRALYAVVGRGVYVLTVRGPGQNLIARGRRGRR